MNKCERRSIRSYQKKADHYDDTFDGRFTYRFKEQLLKTVAVPYVDKVLDIACSNGRLLKMMSQNIIFPDTAPIYPRKWSRIQDA